MQTTDYIFGSENVKYGWKGGAVMKCRDCNWCYNNETMGELYICVNGNSEKFGEFTGLLCEDDCPDGEDAFEFDPNDWE